jgi:hypothetical protein
MDYCIHHPTGHALESCSSLRAVCLRSREHTCGCGIVAWALERDAVVSILEATHTWLDWRSSMWLWLCALCGILWSSIASRFSRPSISIRFCPTACAIGDACDCDRSMCLVCCLGMQWSIDSGRNFVVGALGRNTSVPDHASLFQQAKHFNPKPAMCVLNVCAVGRRLW